MRSTLACVCAVVILATVRPSTVVAQQRPEILGTRVTLTVRGRGSASGELLAAGVDSVWLLAPGGVRPVALADVTGARVRLPGPTAGSIGVWALVGGIVTGGALTAACSSVEGTSCGAVFLGAAVSWLLVGGASAAAAGSGYRRIGVLPEALAPYARFPQGLPPDYRPPPTEERRLHRGRP